MKKFFKVFFIVLFVLFVIILAVPLAFKGQLMDIAKREVNKSVKAQVDWTGFHVSLFKGFPDLKVTMDDLSVMGIGAFEGDTLVAFRGFSAKVDLFSAFSGKAVVKSIILDRPVINAIAMDDSTFNWDITYPSEEVSEIEADTSSTLDFEVNLKEFRINNARISYFDALSSTFASISDFNFLLSGNLAADYTDLDVDASADAITVDYDGIKYLNEAAFGLKALLGADLKNMKFEISDNEVRINDIVLGLEGFFEMPEDDIDVDVKFFTRETSFRSLLSMIPAIYMKDFEDMETSGNLSLQGDARGKITDTALPEVNLNLVVSDGYFSYPDLPESVNNVAINLKVFYDGVAEDNSRIDMDKFHMEIAGNPIDMNFSVRTPMTDMQMNGALSAQLDFASLKQAIPLEDMSLNGQMNANIRMMGKMSDIENENYEAFKAEGELEIMDMKVEGESIPTPINIEKVKMIFSPQFVNLETLDARMGESDIHMNGRLENFIPYVFKNETVRGELNLRSDLLNLNELLAAETEETEEIMEDTTALAVVEIPDNIDFRMQTRMGKVIYDKLEIENLLGIIHISDKILSMEKLNMDLLQGSMVLNGEYNTQDILTPLIEMNMDMTDIDIQSSFYAFNTVEKLAPVAEMTRGKISVDFDFVSFLDSTMSPVLNSIVGNGNLETESIKIENNETFSRIGNLINRPELANQQFKDVDLSFEIREGRVYVEPFTTRLGTTEVNISGNQGLDQTMDYDLAFKIPRDQFGNTANDFLEDLSSKARAKGFDIKPGDVVNLGVDVTGTFSDPKLSLDVKESLSSTKQQVKEAVEQRVQEEVQKVKEEVKENVNEQIDKIMKEAEAEAEKVRQAAADAGESLIGEAELRKKQLVKEAGNNPLKKIAAEKTGDGLVKTAENQAEKLKAKADKKAEAIMEAARKKAEDLKQK